MREFLFRTWYPKENRWLNGYEVCGGCSLRGETINGYGFLSEVPHQEWADVVIEQYTGFEDMNGRKIYEGDILEYEDAQGYDEDGKGVVIWNVTRGVWFIENDDIDLYDELYNVVDWSSVIGNIHDNPEFMEGI